MSLKVGQELVVEGNTVFWTRLLPPELPRQETDSSDLHLSSPLFRYFRLFPKIKCFNCLDFGFLCIFVSYKSPLLPPNNFQILSNIFKLSCAESLFMFYLLKVVLISQHCVRQKSNCRREYKIFLL